MTNIKLNLYKTEEIEGLYTFKDLYEDMLEEMERYDKLGMLEDLMNANISNEIVDKSGSVLYSLMNFSAGFLEGNVYHIQGALNHVYPEGDGNE